MYYAEASASFTYQFGHGSVDDRVSELTNSLAVFCGTVEGEESAALAEKSADYNNSFTGISLSMIGFKYDALIRVKDDWIVQYKRNIKRKMEIIYCRK